VKKIFNTLAHIVFALSNGHAVPADTTDSNNQLSTNKSLSALADALLDNPLFQEFEEEIKAKIKAELDQLIKELPTSDELFKFASQLVDQYTTIATKKAKELEKLVDALEERIKKLENKK